MAFNIHQLDEIESYNEKAEKMLEKYQRNLLKLFLDSSEGKERLQADPDMGFYAATPCTFWF